MMKGGLYIKGPYTSDTAFRHFIKNSNISYLSKGSFGIIFKCKLNDGIESPYENLRTIYKGKEVRMIIIKFSILHYTHDFMVGPNGLIGSVSIKNYEDEVKIQTEIFNKTIDNLDPICPSIIYSKYVNRNLDDNHHKEMIKLLVIINKKLKDKGVNKLFEELYNYMNKSENYSFGLIGMELMDDYVTLHKLIDNKEISDSDKINYECIARLRLIELAVKTGYSHNDYHQSNILVNPSATGYYGVKNGHVLLIDFGYTKEIPKDILENIRTLYDENKFNEILDIFYMEKRLSNTFPSGRGKYDFIDYPDLYGWIIFENDTLHPTYIKKTNDYITYLKDEYEEYEENVEHSGLQDKKVFTYGEKTELPIIQEIEPTTEEPIIQEPTTIIQEPTEDKTRKRKIGELQGGKIKNKKSMRLKRITNKRRQSKRKQSNRKQSNRKSKQSREKR